MVSYSSTGTERSVCRCIICKCRICIIWLVFGKVSVFISFFLRISLQFNMFNFAVIFPRHVEGQKLDRTVWNLSTFHAYVSYHVKVGFLVPMFFSFFFCGLYQCSLVAYINIILHLFSIESWQCSCRAWFGVIKNILPSFTWLIILHRLGKDLNYHICLSTIVKILLL